VTSSSPTSDGDDGILHYCANSGTAVGIAGFCSCICAPGYLGAHCDGIDSCSASEDPVDDGSEGSFHCINGGIATGTTGDCSCSCPSGYSGDHCETYDVDCRQMCYDGNPATPCYYEPACQVSVSLGCVAMGHSKCRFCGFGDYSDITCPVNPTGAPTNAPTGAPTGAPTNAPTPSPTASPTPNFQVPELTESDVVFHADGSGFNITFQNPTNLGNLELFAQFNCTSILVPVGPFGGKSESDLSVVLGPGNKCWFKSSRHIAVEFGYPATLTSSHTLHFSTNLPIAAEEEGSNPPSSAVMSSTTTVHFGYPSDNVRPEPIITGPTNIGSCEGLELGGTMSSNDGRRPFSTIEWSIDRVVSTKEGIASARDYSNALSSWGGTLTPSAIDGGWFEPGYTYRFKLTLSNFFQDSDEVPSFEYIHKEINVMGGEVPQVRIIGPSALDTTRNREVRVRAEADYPAACPGSSSADLTATELTYTWTISPSVDFLTFGGGEVVISANNLDAMSTYQVNVEVEDTSGRKNTAFQSVNVLSSPLVAVVSPMAISTSTLNPITLSDESFDNDGDGGVWSWEWKGRGVDVSNVGQRSLSLQAGDLNAGEYHYSCKVTRSVEGSVQKTAIANATVIIVAEEGDIIYPVVVIDLPGRSKVNAGDDPLTLPGRLQTVDKRFLPVTYQWSVEGWETSANYFAASRTSAITAIYPGAMRAGVKYVFTLAASDTFGRVSSTSVVLEINNPPVSGWVGVLPESGTSLITVFSLQADGWMDEDLPLEYVFRQYHSPLTGKISENGVDTFLSSGEEAAGWETWIEVEVYDNLGARAVAQKNAIVASIKESQAIAKMRDVVRDAEMKKDGTDMAKHIESGARSVKGKILEADTEEMIDTIERALDLVGGEEGKERIAASIEVVTKKGKGRKGMEKGFNIIKGIIETGGELGAEGIENAVGVIDNTLGFKVGEANETEIYQVLRNIGGRLTAEYAPGMDAKVIEKGQVTVTANSYTVGDDNEVDGGGGTRWKFKGATGGEGEGLKDVFRASGMNVGREAWGSWSTGVLVSNIVSLAVWEPESGGLGWEGGIEIEIPIGGGGNLGEVFNATKVKNGCEVFVGGKWKADLCAVKGNQSVEEALERGSVVCTCSKDAMDFGGGRRFLHEDDDIFVDIGNAFIRAGWVLLEKNSFENLTQQMGILIVLGTIYVIYFYVILRSQIKDWKNVKMRHKELLKTDFVEKAIRAMRENFVRIQLSHKDSVIGDLQRISSFGEMQQSEDGGKTTGGLEAFTNRSTAYSNKKNRLMSDNLLNRKSSLSR